MWWPLTSLREQWRFAAGAAFGTFACFLLQLRLRYGAYSTPWFDLLNLSPRELEDLIVDTGWHLDHLVHGEPPDYYAVLAKDLA
jgi:hypothetical protein